MVVEYIRYSVAAPRADEFEEAYRRASQVLEADPHCLRYEVARGVEEPEHFVVRIEWDSVEGHEQGFRSSPRFAEFFSDVRPFFGEIEEMKHYEVRHTSLSRDDARESGLTRAAVMLTVRDAERSTTFYRDVLGLEQLDYPDIPLLRRGNLQLFLVEESPPTLDRPGITLAPPAEAARMAVNLVFEVEDAHAEYAALIARGLAFLTPPAQPPWGGWRCFAQDPDGYLIEIEQPPSN